MTTHLSILRLALPTPLRRLFDYLPPSGVDSSILIPGVRVCVPFQSRKLMGILIEVVSESEVPLTKLKFALEILDNEPVLPQDVFKLCQWAADYYHYSLGEVLVSALPRALRKGSPLPDPPPQNGGRKLAKGVEGIPLNSAQQQAVTAITVAHHTFQTFLLDGVTGSGKTEVYLQSIIKILEQGQQVLVLVPEISLTPQTIARFRDRFAVPIVALHSSLSEKERLNAWLSARSGEAKIVIGTRSAVFTPFPQLGLIIVDEEHDASFKQQDRFRYHARDVAIMRASILKIPIVLGSATPSLETLHNAKRNRYHSLSLPERAGRAVLPQYHMIDLRQVATDHGLSSALIQTMAAHLQQNNQVMLFLNRRGFAPILFCKTCGFIAACKRCDARMVYHRIPPRLHCHHCDSHREIPKQCVDCGEETLEPIGLGTQRLEQTLAKYFPDVPMIRVDRDNTRRKDAMQDLISQIHQEKRAILLGTQMLAKGHHFPQVTLVGIVDADSGLLSTDFRAAEQIGQLLVQVAGRAGRAEKQGSVLVQTRNPDHVLLQMLIREGYGRFAHALLHERKQAAMPPFSYLAVFRADAYTEQAASQFLMQIKEMKFAASSSVNIFGPIPAAVAKRKGLYSQHLLIKTNQRRVLQDFLRQLLPRIEKIPTKQQVRFVVDVDPVDLP